MNERLITAVAFGLMAASTIGVLVWMWGQDR